MLRASTSNAPVTTGNYIDGVARPAEGGRTYALYNPARPDELVGRSALVRAWRNGAKSLRRQHDGGSARGRCSCGGGAGAFLFGPIHLPPPSMLLAAL